MINPFLPSKMKILDIIPETEIDQTFVLAGRKPVKPGQFFQLSVPGAGEAPVSVSDFEDDKLFVTIRKVGRLTNALFALAPGDYIFARGPYGNGFDYRDYVDSDLKVIAGGTGLAPVKKVIKHFIANKSIASLEVLLGFKTPQDILYRREVRAWVDAGLATLTVDKAGPDWSGNTGLITGYLKNLDLSNLENCKFIVVGPPIMIKFITIELLLLQVPEENIWVSLERKMSCGLGKCGHCKIGETYVCLEGPAFRFARARRLLD
ncbi:MAG: anaerobic sulfite reductase subunit AsrB [Syntrophobacteraceae bacterium]|nr:anaerobic sulfite reductase subunit AsrB [Syntrophobacteraceae bacterium]